jgi:hypothetical protein
VQTGKKEWFVNHPPVKYRAADGTIKEIGAGTERWVEIDGKCASDCIWEGKRYTAEEFLARTST